MATVGQGGSGGGGARFKSIKSLPVDYRFMEKAEKGASGGISVSIPENGSGNMDRDVDDESPYGLGSSLERPSVDDEVEDVNPSVSPQGTVLGSWGNKRWGDTASYVAKKVNLVSKFLIYFAKIILFNLVFVISV